VTDEAAPATAPPIGPAGKSGPGGTAAKRSGAARNPRRRAREFAVQGLYQWLLAGGTAEEVLAYLRDLDGFERADRAHLDALMHGGIEQASALDAVITRHVDRPTKLLSPVEHAVLMIGAYELTHCIDVPYRVVINEAVELAKSFGGTDGHKYVNGVLDKAAADLRPAEVAARRSSGAGAGVPR
jgi:transcription antitermination protein NusB